MNILKSCSILKINFAIILIFLFFNASLYGEAKNIIKAVKISVPPVIDAELNDKCWSESTKITDFVVSSTGNPVTENTEVFICYDDKNIYLAFYCKDKEKDKIIANETKRESYLFNDDYINIKIDTYHDHKTYYGFYVNPKGAQLTSVPGGSAAKIEWQGSWNTVSKIAKYGWIAEISIPFQMLKYPDDSNIFGISFVRSLARKKECSRWPDLGRPTNFLNMADMVFSELPKTDDKPFSVLGYSVFNGKNDDGFKYNFINGLDFRYIHRKEITTLVTVNPDFINVENDLGSINYSYYEKFIGESRPFFTEGSYYLPSNDLLYTQRIKDIDVGMKSFGRIGNLSLGFIGTTAYKKRDDIALRTNYDINNKSNVLFDFVSAQNKEEGVYNNSLGVRGSSGEQYSIGGNYIIGYSYGGDFIQTDITGEELKYKNIYGGSIGTSIGNQSDEIGSIYMNIGLKDTGEKVNAKNGFIPVVDTKNYTFNIGYSNKHNEGFIDYYYISYNRKLENYHSGNIYENGGGTNAYISSKNGFSLYGGYNRYERETSLDNTYNLSFGWNSNDKARCGGIDSTFGKVNNKDYFYIILCQSIKLYGMLENLSFSFSGEYSKMASETEIEENKQYIIGTGYDITPEINCYLRSVIRQNNVNFHFVYRQVVSNGVDIYFLLGEPNSLTTKESVSLKIVVPLF